ncbi:MAG: hypothetical protein VB047_10905 [Anaerotignum propionicum]|uniref:hypothetical protein n=1 Tax=Anaerotignum propionicum TaxID=28446 RepID=UPI002B1EB016|nr:hypothetical protein [Anaerotignum propionicum]MEA5058052.1 hypothetical protein [Anaerotignum propionicum]
MDSVQRMHKGLEEFNRKYQGKRHYTYQMSGEQLLSLRFSGDICGSILKAFNYGFYMGIKYQKIKAKRKAPVTDQSTQGAKTNIQFEDTTESGKSQLGGF